MEHWIRQDQILIQQMVAYLLRLRLLNGGQLIKMLILNNSVF